MAVTAPERLTADEFVALPGDLRYTQLIDGAVVVDSPNTRHQRVADWILHKLMSFAEERPDLGEAGSGLQARLDHRNVFVPDVWWRSDERRLPREGPGHVGPPDLVVEVRSPTTWRYDVHVKKSRYEAAGTPELWLVDTLADSVLVFRRSSSAEPLFDLALEVSAPDQLTTPVVPGFALDLGVLFDR